MPFLPVNHNPYLQPWLDAKPNRAGGQGQIEYPGQGENMVWQTRKAEPTAFEDGLADALETVLDAGAAELDEVVQGLNRLGFRAQDGAAWTTDSLAAQLHALAEL